MNDMEKNDILNKQFNIPDDNEKLMPDPVWLYVFDGKKMEAFEGHIRWHDRTLVPNTYIFKSVMDDLVFTVGSMAEIPFKMDYYDKVRYHYEDVDAINGPICVWLYERDSVKALSIFMKALSHKLASLRNTEDEIMHAIQLLNGWRLWKGETK